MSFSIAHVLLIVPLFFSYFATCQLTPWEQIHQTLHTYALAIDSKNFSLLSSVFAPTGFANYTGPLADLSGLPAIQTALAASVANVDSQHLLGTTVINIDADGETANSTTYFQASLFGKGNFAGQLLVDYGFYRDTLVKSADGAWLIDTRFLVFQGAGMVGNESILGG